MNIAFKPSYKSKTPLHLSIADVLLLGDDEEDDLILMGGFKPKRLEGSKGMECPWPPQLFTRLFAGLRRSKEKRPPLVGREATETKTDDGDVTLVGGLNSRHSFSQFPPSESYEKETSFNLGIGYYLLYLIASSKNEIHKMVELRTQMEMLLKNAKEELRTKDLLPKTHESNDIFEYPITDAPEGPESNSNTNLSPQIFATSHALAGPAATVVCDQSSSCHMPRAECCFEFKGMDQLEAELEAELELLQLHLDSESSNPPPDNIKVAIKESNSLGSQSSSSGEVIDTATDTQEDCSVVHCGVPPYELERRLHEVLEAQQVEQIRELEAALQCARQNLREKEMEISWWKYTARLISMHVAAESSPLTFQHRSDAHRF